MEEESSILAAKKWILQAIHDRDMAALPAGDPDYRYCGDSPSLRVSVLVSLMPASCRGCQVLHNIGTCSVAPGQPETTADSYKAAVRSDPGYAQGWINLGIV